MDTDASPVAETHVSDPKDRGARVRDHVRGILRRLSERLATKVAD